MYSFQEIFIALGSTLKQNLISTKNKKRNEAWCTNHHPTVHLNDFKTEQVTHLFIFMSTARVLKASPGIKHFNGRNDCSEVFCIIVHKACDSDNCQLHKKAKN